MQIKDIKFSNTFMTVIRDYAMKLSGGKSEENLPQPFDGFFLSKEKKGDQEPFKVFSAKELGIGSEKDIFLYKINF